VIEISGISSECGISRSRAQAMVRRAHALGFVVDCAVVFDASMLGRLAIVVLLIVSLADTGEARRGKRCYGCACGLRHTDETPNAYQCNYRGTLYQPICWFDTCGGSGPCRTAYCTCSEPSFFGEWCQCKRGDHGYSHDNLEALSARCSSRGTWHVPTCRTDSCGGLAPCADRPPFCECTLGSRFFGPFCEGTRTQTRTRSKSTSKNRTNSESLSYSRNASRSDTLPRTVSRSRTVSADCLAGEYTSPRCAPCSRGSWSNVGAFSCNACPAGTASAVLAAKSAATCVACAAGTFAAAGSANCTWCMPGTWSLAGAAECTPCPNGTWFNGTGLNSSAGCVDVPPAAVAAAPALSQDAAGPVMYRAGAVAGVAAAALIAGMLIGMGLMWWIKRPAAAGASTQPDAAGPERFGTKIHLADPPP